MIEGGLWGKQQTEKICTGGRGVGNMLLLRPFLKAPHPRPPRVLSLPRPKKKLLAGEKNLLAPSLPPPPSIDTCE